MAGTPTTCRGTIHGKTIYLEMEPGLQDGQQVTVTVEPISPAKTSENPLEALQRAAGSWSDDPEGLDWFLEWNRQQRKVMRRELPE